MQIVDCTVFYTDEEKAAFNNHIKGDHTDVSHI